MRPRTRPATWRIPGLPRWVFTSSALPPLDGTDHSSHKEQASMIRRYIIWRNNHAYDERLRRIVDRANAA